MATLRSSVETSIDLVRFPDACGGWSNVATVLAEPAEQIDPCCSPPRRRSVKTAPSARGVAFYPSSSSDSTRSAFRLSRVFSFFFRSDISFLTLRSSARFLTFTR